jgi:hypothetical protein
LERLIARKEKTEKCNSSSAVFEIDFSAAAAAASVAAEDVLRSLLQAVNLLVAQEQLKPLPHSRHHQRRKSRSL